MNHFLASLVYITSYYKLQHSLHLAAVTYIIIDLVSTFDLNINVIIVIMPEIYSPHPDYDFDRNFKGYGEKGLKVEWPNKAKIGVSFVINYEEVRLPLSLAYTFLTTHYIYILCIFNNFLQGAESSVLQGDGVSEMALREFSMGPPWVNERNYNTESEYEYGSRAGFWRLFRLFTKYRMKYTLYAVAQACEEQPEVVQRSVQEGHDVASQ